MTKQKKKTFIIVGGLVLLIVVIAIIVRKRKRDQEELMMDSPASSGSSAPTSPINTNSSACSNTTVLKKGMRCDRVEWSQYYINKIANHLHIEPLVQDGVFGSKTESAFLAVLGKKTGSYAEIKASVDLVTTNPLI